MSANMLPGFLLPRVVVWKPHVDLHSLPCANPLEGTLNLSKRIFLRLVKHVRFLEYDDS